MLQVHPASVQDRDGAVPLLQASRRSYPFIERAFADSAYAAERVADATCIAVEIVLFQTEASAKRLDLLGRRRRRHGNRLDHVLLGPGVTVLGCLRVDLGLGRRSPPCQFGQQLRLDRPQPGYVAR